MKVNGLRTIVKNNRTTTYTAVKIAKALGIPVTELIEE